MCAASDKITAEIERAFGDVRLDGGRTLEQANALDDYEVTEAELLVLPPREERWQSIPDDVLRAYPCVHPFLDVRGFRFYLPAFMRSVVRHLDDEDRCGTIQRFTPWFRPVLHIKIVLRR